MELHKQFLRAVLPSMLAFALSGVYAIADGFFVGNALGDQALAFPFRTRQLSSPAPKILAWRRAGKIGSADTKNGLLRRSVFCYVQKSTE